MCIQIAVCYLQTIPRSREKECHFFTPCKLALTASAWWRCALWCAWSTPHPSVTPSTHSVSSLWRNFKNKRDEGSYLSSCSISHLTREAPWIAKGFLHTRCENLKKNWPVGLLLLFFYYFVLIVCRKYPHYALKYHTFRRMWMDAPVHLQRFKISLKKTQSIFLGKTAVLQIEKYTKFTDFKSQSNSIRIELIKVF